MKQFLLIAVLLFAAHPSAQAASNEHNEMLDALRAADHIRTTETQVQQEWADEQMRLEALILSLEAARDRSHKHKTALLQQQTALLAEQATTEELPHTINAYHDALAAVCAGTHQQLEQLTLLPGIVPDRRSTITDSGSTQLHDLFERLQESANNQKVFDVSLADAQKQGTVQAVSILRCGSVAAWWRSLDGQETGIARWDGTQYHCEKSPNDESAQAIQHAFAIAAGKRNPTVLSLPLHTVSSQQQASNK